MPAHRPVTGAGWEQHPYLLESRDMDLFLLVFRPGRGPFPIKKSHRARLVLLSD